MPIYEYGCQDCGKVFEHLARRLGDEPASCPACGSKDLKRALSVFSAGTSKAGVSAGCRDCPGSEVGCHAMGGGHGPNCGCCHH